MGLCEEAWTGICKSINFKLKKASMALYMGQPPGDDPNLLLEVPKYLSGCLDGQVKDSAVNYLTKTSSKFREQF